MPKLITVRIFKIRDVGEKVISFTKEINAFETLREFKILTNPNYYSLEETAKAQDAKAQDLLANKENLFDLKLT
ncbi:13208_t:CDS:2 [Entrophospora sp. SA101]|nr:8279_t:CDS:2 [Entrophospora sp. SA101]CAJ0907911.1 13208_t:CDS:2 [Entrophospora sp. SA101]